ncbi:GNAT family N-acetyltransferase [Robertmurraya andreesenii]|uniref:Ribosomal-protein-alanine N-acetyltransferase n=1 Tax=Anoxybacillus andreesenii TaxID=1325932 RepID=A0ABT9V0I4_9BACL|nr:GNAT family protein [Robertmurraya andreesenii]MDQ0154466.1 ribosomal-protein-alanine N-acetyltransferase [Robertmurraya andreesenii]
MKKRFPVLETERLILREIIETDRLDILEYLSDEEVMKFYGMSPFRDEEEALEEINWYRKIFDFGVGIRWGITLKEINKVIGSCGFHNWDKRHHRAEIGFELSKHYWNKGIMGEALRAIIPFGFVELNINRIQALVEPENFASLGLLKKLKFNEEGLLAQYEFTCDKYDDLLMLARLKKDF